MKTYELKREKGDAVCIIQEGGVSRYLSPADSLAVRKHSPQGFEFGYSGSGPAQLALAILLDYVRGVRLPDALALDYYQPFKNFFVARVKEAGIITGAEIQKVLDALEAGEN